MNGNRTLIKTMLSMIVLALAYYENTLIKGEWKNETRSGLWHGHR